MRSREPEGEPPSPAGARWPGGWWGPSSLPDPTRKANVNVIVMLSGVAAGALAGAVLARVELARRALCGVPGCHRCADRAEILRAAVAAERRAAGRAPARRAAPPRTLRGDLTAARARVTDWARRYLPVVLGVALVFAGSIDPIPYAR